jgi:hypothetical protein
MLINYILKNKNIELLNCEVDANNRIFYEQLLFRDDLDNQETLIECYHSHSPATNLHYHSSFTHGIIEEIHEHVWYDGKHQIVEYRLYVNKLSVKILFYDYHDNGSISCIRVYGKYEEYYDDKGNLVRRRDMIDETKWSPWENYGAIGSPIWISNCRV